MYDTISLPHERIADICWLQSTKLIVVGYGQLNSTTVLDFLHYSVGAKLRYMGYFAGLLHPPGRKSWLLFPARDMAGGLRNPCFTKFSVVRFL